MSGLSSPQHNALITGASSGLGAAAAVEFANKGFQVILVARRKSRLRSVQKHIRSAGGSARIFPADLRSVDEANSMLDSVKCYGPIDVLVNIAGAYLEGPSVWETETEDWDALLSINLRAPFLMCRALVPEMISTGYGRIVNIISSTKTLSGIGAFRVSKIGLEVLTLVLAEEVPKETVSVTSLNPGLMRTEISDYGRSPRVIARVISSLIDKETAYLNGATLDIVWRGRKWHLRRRPKKAGTFG